MLVKLNNKSARVDAKTVGGKGLNLIRLSALGFRVPEGFVISTEEFEQEVQDIKPKINKILESIEEIGFSEASGQISSIISSIKFSNGLKNKIDDLFQELGLSLVAVRSSAASEDGAGASWAGQLSTKLNVEFDNLESAIKECWASAYSARALDYATTNNFNLEDISIAVVVQQMIQSEVSGVAFSANPITKDESQVLIEAAYGLGEAIVSGAVTPDDYIVDGNSSEIVDLQIATQTKKLSLSDSGTDWIAVPAELQDAQKLSLGEIQDLAQTVKKIEEGMGYKADVEWALFGGQIYITQSRPITTLSLEDAPPERVFKKGEELFRWGPTNAKYFYIGDYIETTFDFFGKKMNLTYAIFYDDKMVWVSSAQAFRQFCKGQFKSLISNQDIVNKNFKKQEDINEKLDVLYQNIDNLKFSSWDEAIINLENLNSLIVDFWQPTLEGEMANYGSEAYIKDILEKNNYSEKEILRIMEVMCTPEDESFLTKITNELKSISDDNLDKFAYYYRWLENGYGGVKELDSSYFKKIATSLSSDSKPANKNEIIAKKKQVIEKYNLTDELSASFRLLTQLILEQDIRKMQMMKLQEIKLKYLKEAIKFSQGMRDLGIEALLDYSLSEIIKNCKEGTPPEPRANEFGYYNTKGRCEPVNNSAAKSVWYHYGSEKTSDYQGKLLTGNTASYGVISKIRGRARVVEDWQSEEADNFQDGEVLVTIMTTPEYLSLMKKSSAIVTDVGGLTSHAAIVARELGKPCIVGTKAGTKLIKTGDQLFVDTHTGIVEIQ